MTNTDQRASLGRLAVAGALTGLVAAVAAVVVLRLLGIEMSSAVIGGVAGAVAGSMAPTVASRMGKPGSTGNDDC